MTHKAPLRAVSFALMFLLCPGFAIGQSPSPSKARSVAQAGDSNAAPTIGDPAQTTDVPAKEAFDAAKELGTVEAWNGFLKIYPTGFYSNMARAYLTRLTEGATPSPPNSASGNAPSPAAPGGATDPKTAVRPSAGGTTAPKASVAAPPAPDARAAPPSAPDAVPGGAASPPVPRSAIDPKAVVAAPVVSAASAAVASTEQRKPAVTRGGAYMGFPEKFNRYYTDLTWKPTKTVYVSPDGTGDGTTREKPTSAQAAVAVAAPGTLIYFTRGAYQGCFDFSKTTSGTYDNPIVLYAERKPDDTVGVSLNCCKTGRQTCFNLEAADYVAVDGFELIGGKYGVRAVGAGYAASQHSRGVAVLGCNGHDQDNDPFFSGQADWAVWERSAASGAKKGDGHGIYLSNGGDWNIVRFNETYGNFSSDFQINADPTSTCKDEGIAFTDPRCDSYAGTGEGGQGASDYFLVDSNFFHHGLGPGANFTSVRRSVIRNNIFGVQARHNVSFWQETDNPKLGTADNKIVHNLFVTTGGHGVKFEKHSTRNEFANNVILGVKIDGGTVKANPSALLMEVDGTVGENVYRSNLYVSGKFEGRVPNRQETTRGDFSSSWFTKFPAQLHHEPNDFMPTAPAPFLGVGTLSPSAISDRNGTVRAGQVDLGPIEVK